MIKTGTPELSKKKRQEHWNYFPGAGSTFTCFLVNLGFYDFPQ